MSCTTLHDVPSIPAPTRKKHKKMKVLRSGDRVPPGPGRTHALGLLRRRGGGGGGGAPAAVPSGLGRPSPFRRRPVLAGRARPVCASFAAVTVDWGVLSGGSGSGGGLGNRNRNRNRNGSRRLPARASSCYSDQPSNSRQQWRWPRVIIVIIIIIVITAGSSRGSPSRSGGSCVRSRVRC